MSPLVFPSQVCVSFRHVHGALLGCEPHNLSPSTEMLSFVLTHTSIFVPGDLSDPWDLTWSNTFRVGLSLAPLPPLLGVCPAGLLCTLQDTHPSPCVGCWVRVLPDCPASFPAHVALWLTDACSRPPLLTFSHICPNLNRLSVYWSLRDVQETSVGCQPTGLCAMHTLGLQVAHAVA